MLIPLFRRSSFRVQIGLLFGAIVITLAAAMSFVLGRMMSDTIRTQAGQSMQLVASNAARVLADGLHDRLLLIRRLADSPELWEDGLASDEVRRTLDLNQSTRANVAWLGVTDGSGRVQAATGRLLLGVDVSERPWFNAGRIAPHVGDLHPAKLLAKMLPNDRNGEPQRFVDFAAPIRRGSAVIGVLAMHGDWDWAHSVVTSLLPENAASTRVQVFIFDRNGTMIYAPGDASAAAAYLAAGQRLPVGAADAGNAADVVQWADGLPYLTSAAPLRARETASDLGWRVVARMPAEAALGDARRAVRGVFGFGAFAALVASLIAWLVAGSVSGPLSSIASAARRLQQGKPDARIPTLGNNRELADLGDALTAMTQRLLASNEDLEHRVAVRTADLEHANAELDRLARFDPLTEVYNRRGFDEQTRVAIASARRRGSALSVIMVDADHFKRVNDLHGHEAGDRVLKTLALALTQRLRSCDIVGRIGGEEFAALLPDTDLRGARQLAEQLVHHVAAVVMTEVGAITISCGVAAVNPGDDGAKALRQADSALYRAKAAGRNRIAWQEPEFDEELQTAQ